MASTCTSRTAFLVGASSQNGRVTLAMSAIVSVLSACVVSPDTDTSAQKTSPQTTLRAGSPAVSSSGDAGGGGSVQSKLARLGLELITERDAGIPERERGRYVPCRVLAGSSAPLAPDPAGYLIVGFDGQLADDASKILVVLDRWRVGETISLWVRRNPFLAAEPDWWEVNDLPVTMR